VKNKRVPLLTETYDLLLEEARKRKYVLKLFISGNTPQSARAIINILEICETHLQGRYQLEVIDIHQQNELVKKEQIIAVPTLIKYQPLPYKKIVGDLSKKERVLIGLDLIQFDGKDSA
jgi:circadian clock protein KaiB